MRTVQQPSNVPLGRRAARTIGIAAGLTAVVNLLSLLVALLWIGPAALVDRTVLTALALHNPAPILVQDGLKLVSAALSIVLLNEFFRWLRPGSPRTVTIGTLFGSLSVLCLLGNAALSLSGTLALQHLAPAAPEQVTAQVGLVIGLLAFGAIMLNGGWYGLVHWAARQQHALPRGLTLLGLVMGGLSLLPPLGIVVLVLSMIWAVWINRVMLLSVLVKHTGQ